MLGTLRNALAQPPDVAAKALLGCDLIRIMPEGDVVACRIVEAEAYHESEPCCHAYRGVTRRNASMFMRAGHAYIYLIYGMYYCLNVSCGKEGEGAAVLIRAAEPVMPSSLRLSGPGLLCQALCINRELDGCDMLAPASSLRLHKRGLMRGEEVAVTKRIGLPAEDNLMWRFTIAQSPYLSRKAKKA